MQCALPQGNGRPSQNGDRVRASQHPTPGAPGSRPARYERQKRPQACGWARRRSSTLCTIPPGCAPRTCPITAGRRPHDASWRPRARTPPETPSSRWQYVVILITKRGSGAASARSDRDQADRPIAQVPAPRRQGRGGTRGLPGGSAACRSRNIASWRRTLVPGYWPSFGSIRRPLHEWWPHGLPCRQKQGGRSVIPDFPAQAVMARPGTATQLVCGTQQTGLHPSN